MKKIAASIVTSTLFSVMMLTSAQAAGASTFGYIYCKGPDANYPWLHNVYSSNGVSYSRNTQYDVDMSVTRDGIYAWDTPRRITTSSTGSWSTPTYITGPQSGNHFQLTVTVYSLLDHVVGTAKSECYFGPPAAPGKVGLDRG